MRAQLTLRMIDDDGREIASGIVADLEKRTKGAEDLGLTLAEARALLARLQQAMVETQMDVAERAVRAGGSPPAPEGKLPRHLPDPVR